jgi:hypothetical protein
VKKFCERNQRHRTSPDPCRLGRQVKKFSHASRFSLTKLLHLPGKLAGVAVLFGHLISLTKLVHLPDKLAGVKTLNPEP